jgi:hypothetical protein
MNERIIRKTLVLIPAFIPFEMLVDLLVLLAVAKVFVGAAMMLVVI